MLFAAAIFLSGCAGQDGGGAERMLKEAAEKAEKEGTVLRGQIRSEIAGTVVLGADSVYFDPERVKSAGEHSAAPGLEEALIGLKDLGDSAALVVRTRGRDGHTVLEAEMEPERVKERVRAYFAAHRSWMRRLYGEPGAGPDAGVRGPGALEAEERKWEELLDSLDASAVYRLYLDPASRRLIRLDASMTLRYNKDGGRTEEHIAARYEAVRGDGPPGG